jgi:hypothetical protein
VLFINLPSFFILVCPQAGHAAASTPMVFYIYYHKHPVYAIKNTHTEMPCSSKYRPETCLIFSIIYKFWKYSIVTAETPAPAGKACRHDKNPKSCRSSSSYHKSFLLLPVMLFALAHAGQTVLFHAS